MFCLELQTELVSRSSNKILISWPLYPIPWVKINDCLNFLSSLKLTSSTQFLKEPVPWDWLQYRTIPLINTLVLLPHKAGMYKTFTSFLSLITIRKWKKDFSKNIQREIHSCKIHYNSVDSCISSWFLVRNIFRKEIPRIQITIILVTTWTQESTWIF